MQAPLKKLKRVWVRELKTLTFAFAGLCWGVICFLLLLPIALAVRLVRSNPPTSAIKHVSLGILEVAGNLRDYQNLFVKYGVGVKRAYSALNKINIYYGDNRILSVDSFGRKLYFQVIDRVMNVVDLSYGLVHSSHFYLVWHKSYLPFNIDYPLIRISGAKLIIQHCGDDVRCRHLHDAIFDYYCPGISSASYAADNFFDTLRKIFRQYWAELFGFVLSTRNQATFQRGPLHHFFFPQEQICCSPKKPNQKIIIVHAPSDRNVKRTDIVLRAIEILQCDDFDFEFKLIENVSNKIVTDILLSADIVIDQPATWPARFAIEGCSASCCVISGNHFEFIGRDSSPVFQFEPDAQILAEIIRVLLIDSEFLGKKMSECWHFWKKYYSYEAVWDCINQLNKGEAAVFYPLINQKELILGRCDSNIERFFVKYFFYPLK